MPETQPRPEIPIRPRIESQPEQLPVSPEFERRPAPVEAPTPIPLLPPTPAVKPLDAMPAQAPVLAQKVEQVLADGLEETYRGLDPATQAKFKIEGEATATKISILLGEAKVQSRKILELIVTWLKIIPGVNRFFLEQEAKIKADKLMQLRR